ncbi:hypothetical protein GF362_07405 [Candidatus Dojkabacteria bacterium]|nr:hypothetical protein [Candidatus Dojkabacteria bacterium]
MKLKKIAQIFLSIFILFFLTTSSQGKTTAKLEDCKLKVEVNIAITGPGASNAYASRIKQAAENEWNNAKVKCGEECKCELELTVNVIQVDDCSKPEANDHHCVTVKNVPVGGYHRPTVTGTASNWTPEDSTRNQNANIPSGTGDWGSRDSNKTIAHEVGHMMGLDDEYTDGYYYRYKKSDGTYTNWQFISKDDYNNADKKKKIEDNKPAGATVDWYHYQQNGRRTFIASKPKAGKEKSLMASVKADAKPEDSHAEDISNDTGIECPDECCCGDGKVQGDKGESCDYKVNPTGCKAQEEVCTRNCKCAVATPICGDGYITPPEECDPKAKPKTGCEAGEECTQGCKCKKMPENTATEKPVEDTTATEAATVPDDQETSPGDGGDDPTLTPEPEPTTYIPTDTPTPTPTETPSPTESQGPILEVVPTFLDFGLTDDVKQVTISNIGDGPLVWNLIPECPEGIFAEPPTGVVDPDPNILEVYIFRDMLPPGNTSCYLYIMSDGGEEAVSVNVEVEEPTPEPTPTPTP